MSVQSYILGFEIKIRPTQAEADLAPPRVYAAGFIQIGVLRKRGLGEKCQAAEQIVRPHS